MRRRGAGGGMFEAASADDKARRRASRWMGAWAGGVVGAGAAAAAVALAVVLGVVAGVFGARWSAARVSAPRFRVGGSASLLNRATAMLSKEAAARNGGSEWPDPVWWLADEQDDWYEKEYFNRRRLWAVRSIERKHFFTGMCGFYRFNISAMPSVSVIVTVQNEQDRMLSLTVHSILARTPPELLREIIVVDDNGLAPDVRGTGVNETEFDDLLAMSGKVLILRNEAREGCARSRMVGARAASGDVLMFVDSHIEMMSATWLQHLLLPIMENPRTMALQTLDIISDLDHSYGDGSGDLLYGIITDQFWFGYQRERFMGQEKEKPGRRAPYETPFGPGSLFAIRRDEFWRLGGYDKGLYVWGGENTELALKMWTCGGRMVMVPCSRVGHMYRIHLKEVGRWPPALPQPLTDKLGCGHSGQFMVHGAPADNFTKIITRNNMRIMNVWVGDHPAKYGYYQRTFGTAVLPPEWQQYEDEMANDPAAQEQIQLRERNKCRNFEWFDTHVYKKLTGFHHPWHPSIKEKHGGKTWI